MIASITASLSLSLLALMFFAWGVMWRVRQHTQPDCRRDMTLACADKPAELEAWFYAKVNIVTAPVKIGVGVVVPAMMLIVTFTPMDISLQGHALAILGLGWFHFAVSLPACAATILLFGAWACRNRRELPGGVFVVAALAGALSALAGPTLMYLLASSFGNIDSAFLLAILVIFIPAVAMLSVTVLPLVVAQKLLAREYPWSE